MDCTCRKRANAGVPGAVAPGKINLESPPSPEGKGVGGMGAESKLKAGAAGDKQGKPPLRIPERQGQPMTSRASPPPARDTRPCSGAARVQPRGCKGFSPLHKKTKNLPLPRRGRALCERGSGGWGQKSRLTEGSPGDQPGKPPQKITPAPAARGKQSQNRARQLHRTPLQKYEEEARCRRTGR